MIVITRCGHDSKHKTKFNSLKKTGLPNYLLLLIKTEAFFETDGQIIETKPNTAILFDRNTYIHYGSKHTTFNDDWIYFDFIDEKSLLNGLHIPFNQPVYLPYMSKLSNYVRLLVQETHTAMKHKEQIQDSLMRLLLYNLDSQISTLPSDVVNHKHYLTMNQLRTNIHNTPHKKWTVEIMSTWMNISPSYFQHLYKEFFGISCMKEVIQARLDNSKFYLSTTDMSIQALSDFCGYDNEMHFMRQFKKFEGMTPTQYRQLFKEK